MSDREDSDDVSAQVRNPARLALVRSSGLLDSPAEPEFDELTWMAARLLAAPLAFLSVVDDRRAYWKSYVGSSATDGRRGNPVRESVCQHVIALDRAVVVPDTRSDPLTRGNTTLRDQGIRAWIGYPLRCEGQVLGAFCVLDTVPRRWSEDDLQSLETLARAASTLVAYRQARERAESARQLAGRLSREVQVLGRRAARLASAMRNSLTPHGRWAVGPIEVASNVRPASVPGTVGGAFLDISSLPGERWSVSLGEVGGGGGPEPAGPATFVRQSLRAHQMTSPSLAESMRGLDHAVFDRLGAFGPEVSCTSLWLEPVPGGLAVECAVAGRAAPVIRGLDGRLHPLGGPAPMLGNEVGPVRALARARIASGEALVLVSVAVLDATAPHGGEPFGWERMSGVLRATAAQDPAEVARALGEAAIRHAGGHLPDDLVVLVVEPRRADPDR